ncbi:Phage-related protein, tail component [Budvicia aquatica]|uniref:Phage-related protein, tail component n=1 Tax=Budvicia aquatica TaxID=82979 RepID=A0A484ZJW1_9GAMM|nr:Phage-related protein, tail component [Budvicia aquatica]
MHALLLQVPGLRQHIKNDFYRVRIAGKDISQNNLKIGMSSLLKKGDVIHIVPRSMGAKSAVGIFQAIAGAILVVVGIYSENPQLIATGAGLMLGGVISMLTKMPQTKIDGNTTSKNTYFSNLDNVLGQGRPIPVCYGEMMVGSQVLSQGLETS